MASADEGKKTCFTFVWILENISYCHQKIGEPITSPAFLADNVGKTKWMLVLFPRGKTDGDHIGFHLCRHANCKGVEDLEVDFELAFLAADGTVLRSLDVSRRAIRKEEICGWSTFEKRSNVFVEKRSSFLPNDSLFARCKIWAPAGRTTEDVYCFARTRVGVERRSFMWHIKNFSNIQSENNSKHEIKSLSDGRELMSLGLVSNGGMSSVRFELTCKDPDIKYCTLRASLVDTNRKAWEISQGEFWFDTADKCRQFHLRLLENVLANRQKYLPNDVLTLQLECAFSNGISSEEIKHVIEGCESLQPGKLENHEFADMKTNSPNHALRDVLKSLQEEKFLCDVKLKTGTGLFPAHKSILGAWSPVFREMFSNKKKIANVNIEGLNNNEVRQMLEYMYSAVVPNLHWKSAANLYIAANTFAIESLKDLCFNVLKNNISSDNACELLWLADMRKYDELKKIVQHFILKNDQEVINSDEWNLLMERNPKLAAETACLKYK